MMNGLSCNRTTIAYVCAVVVLFCSFFALTLVVFAQENTEDQSRTTPSVNETEEIPQAPLGYTVESLGSQDEEAVGDFVVGPGKTELTIEPGSAKKAEIIVSNRTGDERVFNLVVEDATGSSDPEVPIVLLGDDRGPYTLKDYIQLPVTSFTLKHNERARIPVTIAVPPDAEPGGRYGSVLVTTVSKDAEIGANGGATPSSAIVSRVGTLFFLTIPGETTIEGELVNFATLPDKTFFTDGPINFQILFENKGALHLNPYGEIRITNLLNEEVGFVELDPWFALPQSLRSREVTWNRELLIGKYTATAHINRGYDDIVDTQTVTFWVLPWKVVLPLFLCIFVVFFALRFIGKNFEFKRKSN